MNLSIYQIILGLIALIFIVNVTVKFMKKESGQTFFKFAVTFVIWISIFFLAIFPRVSHILSLRLGLGENLNTLIFIGFVVIFIIIFRLLSVVERVERNISEIVRKEALSKLERNNK